ncbi:MAG: Hint domain-containing protein [Pseudomonadota bacterium]
MTTITVDVYDYDPWGNFPQTTGATFTYSGPAAPETTITITDNGSGTDDLSLEDDTAGETATGTITINGTTSTNVSVSAEEGWTLRDPLTGEEFQVVTLDVESGPATGYYMISEVPLVAGRIYEVREFDSTPNSANGDPLFTYSEYVCFAPGTLILTPDGTAAVEDLCTGDLIETLDRGPARIVWTGARTLDFDREAHAQKPIEIKAGALGPALPARDLVLSPQHRVLLAGPEVRKNYGEAEVLGMAKGLAHLPRMRRMNGCRSVTYHSILTERHSIILANGLAVESFYPGRYAQSLLGWFDRLRLMAMFPGISHAPEAVYGPHARPVLKRRQVELLSEPAGRGAKPSTRWRSTRHVLHSDR